MYPYLLRNLPITPLNQVWCSDITYIPVENGFLYLVAIIDWATRKVLAWRLSNTLDAGVCVEALEEAIAIPGDGRTATSLVAACRGQMAFLTPGAYTDHIRPYLKSDTPQEHARRWRELVELVRQRSSDIDALVDELHAAARAAWRSGVVR